MLGAARGALRGGFGCNRQMIMFLTVPRRNAVTPPQLARQRPIADVAHPVEIFFATVVGDNLEVAALHGGDGRLRQRLHLAEPLGGSARLHNGAAAFADSNRVGVVANFLEQVERLQILDDFFSRREAFHSGVGAGGSTHVAVVGHHIDFGEMVPASDLEVVRIVRGGDFYGAGAELAVHHFVGDDGNFAIHKRHDGACPDQFLVAFILGMHRDGGVAEHGFRARGSHDQIFFAPGDRVANVPEVPGAFFVDHFQVAQHGQADGAPVGHAFVAVDQPLVVQAHEDFADHA